MTDALRFVFIELGRFNKYLWELDKWRYLLKHIHELQEIPKELSDPFFKRVFMLAKINKCTTEEKEQYLKSLGDMGDYTNIINTATEEVYAQGEAVGEAKGIAKGEAIGSEKKNLENARKFKELGVSVDIISQAIGLPLEVINEL